MYPSIFFTYLSKKRDSGDTAYFQQSLCKKQGTPQTDHKFNTKPQVNASFKYSHVTLRI